MNIYAFIYRIGYPVAKYSRLITKPHVHAAACIIEHAESLLFVRHTYGDRSLWRIPGGHTDPGETGTQAALREAYEEVGIRVQDVVELGVINSSEDFKTADVTICAGKAPSKELVVDPHEISEAKWFPITQLPTNVRSGTIEALEMYYLHRKQARQKHE